MARRAVRCLAASLVAGLMLMALPARAGAAAVDVEPQQAAGSGCGGRIPAVDAVDASKYVGRWFQVRDSRSGSGWLG